MNTLTGQHVTYERDRQFAFLNGYVRAFHVADAALIRRFCALNRSWNGLFECSCKVSQEQRHAARMGFWIERPALMLQHYRLLQQFELMAQQFGFRIDLDEFEDFCNECVEFSQVKCMATAIDLRDTWEASRLKIYYVFINGQDAVRRALMRSGDEKELPTVDWCCEWTLGFDFHLDGRTSLRCYPMFRSQTVPANAEDVLSPEILELLPDCEWMDTANRTNGKILNCRPLRPLEFLKKMPVEVGIPDTVQTSYGPATFKVFSFPESQYAAGAIRDYALYFWM